jgi:hypothetical protein
MLELIIEEVNPAYRQKENERLRLYYYKHHEYNLARIRKSYKAHYPNIRDKIAVRDRRRQRMESVRRWQGYLEKNEWPAPMAARVTGIPLPHLRALVALEVIPMTPLDSSGYRVYSTSDIGILTAAATLYLIKPYRTKRVRDQFDIEGMRKFIDTWWLKGMAAYERHYQETCGASNCK